MRDDPVYWNALSERIVSIIWRRREARFGWRVWTAPLVAAAVLMILIAGGRRASAIERAPTIATMMGPGVQRAPSIVTLLQEPP